MLSLGRAASFAVLFFVAQLAFGQGSAAGFGQGGAGGFGQLPASSFGQMGGGGGRGGGGGFGGGGMGGFPGRSADGVAPNEQEARPDDDNTANLWETRTAILTPGDRVEYKFKMGAGETIFASATSDAFDPALAIADDKGKELAKNDDRAEGDQSPFLIFRTPSEGTYTLKVLSYRSVSGGKFTVKFRTLKTTDAGFGLRMHKEVTAVATSNPNMIDFRLTAKKDKFYDLGTLSLGGPGHPPYYVAGVRIVGPTGVAANDYEVVPTPDGTTLFRALVTGDFYVEYIGVSPMHIETEYQELSPAPLKARDHQVLDLQPRELRIFEMPVTPNLIVHTVTSGPAYRMLLSKVGEGAEGLNQSNDRGDGNGPGWTWFRMNVDLDNDVVRVFRSAGTVRVIVRAQGMDKTAVTLNNDDTLPAWNGAESTKGAIDIGDARLFLLKSTKSELMQVAAEASHFQLKMEIFRRNGELANTLMQRRSHTVSDNLYFPDADTFIIRISCDGNGGSGDFALRRDTIAATPYAIGSTQTLTLDASHFGLYSMDLVAGKRYELIFDRDNFLRSDLLDEEGQFLFGGEVGFDNVIVKYFVPVRSGRHRLWLRGAGKHTFKFQANVPPTLGK